MESTDEQRKLDAKLRLIRSERYACQSVARKALPKERVTQCLRRVNGSNVQVCKHRKTDKAFYSGLLICGSIWTCPVCAAKVSERRRKELKHAFEMHKENGGKIGFLTLTFSHKKHDSLADILFKFSQATKKFMGGRAFQNIRDELGMIGRVKALEVTYSDINGFHPHAHLGVFYTNDVSLEELQAEMYILWEKACSKVGLTVNEKHGLKFEDGDVADEYLSKHGSWGIDQELTKGHVKKAKHGSFSPFDFLREYLVTEDFKYIKLFREYAECFKGKRQLQWSRGLKKRFLLEEKSDEQVAKEKIEEADVLGLLDLSTWKEILKYDNRSYFLDLCENVGFEKAVSIIQVDKKKASPLVAETQKEI